MAKSFDLYFHAPCFDGAGSAAIASEWLERTWPGAQVHLHARGYTARDTWPSTVKASAVVVDFLFHPNAYLWADHHRTTFLSPAFENAYRSRQPSEHWYYDVSAPSCARVLWDMAIDHGSSEWRHFADIVEWADVIDGARYASVEDAVAGEAPAIKLALALFTDRDHRLSLRLAKLLRTATLQEACKAKSFQHAYRLVDSLRAEGLSRFRSAAKVEGECVLFEVDTEGSFVSRYAPFYFFREARFSVGILHSKSSLRVTAMANPWMPFDGPPLGDLFAPYGGGGHARVASVILPVHARETATVIQRAIFDRVCDSSQPQQGKR